MQHNNENQNPIQENFEEYLAIITQCLEKLGDENLSLHESLQLYKEGMIHLKKAQNMLENAQFQCDELKKQFQEANKGE